MNLNLSYANSNELNKIIDSLPSRPRFHRSEIVVAGEVMELWHRDIVECIRVLYGDPEFSADLIFKPERHYFDEDKTLRIYSDMHTGKWWWETQVRPDIYDHCYVVHTNNLARLCLKMTSLVRQSFLLSSPPTKHNSLSFVINLRILST